MQDENNRLKGEQGRPKVLARCADPVDHSSEAERRVAHGWVKQVKSATIPIDRDETRDVDRDLLPPDAEFKVYEAVIVQDVIVHTANVRFFKETWYAHSQRHTYLVNLSTGYDGQFDPTLTVLIWYFASQMTDTHDRGIPAPSAHPDLRRADLEPADQTAERTACRESGYCRGRHGVLALAADQHMAPWINAKDHHCHMIINPLSSVYYTLPGRIG